MANETILDGNRHIKKGEFFKEDQVDFAFDILTNSKFSSDEVRTKLNRLIEYLKDEQVSNTATIKTIEYMANHTDTLNMAMADAFKNYPPGSITTKDKANKFMEAILDDEARNNGQTFGIVFEREVVPVAESVSSSGCGGGVLGCGGSYHRDSDFARR